MFWKINFFITLLLFKVSCSSFIFGMDTLLSATHKDITWDIVLTHGVPLFNAYMVAVLAKVSKEHRKIVFDTTHVRKEYWMKHDNFIEEITDKNARASIIWDIYGIQCGMVEDEKISSSLLSSDVKKVVTTSIIGMMMAHRRLGEGFTRYNRWCCFDNFLPYHPKPFFNEQGYFCCYGVSRDKCIVEYSVSQDKIGKKLCKMQLNETLQENGLGLETFLEFPVLLQACLQSCHIIEEERGNFKNIVVGIKRFFLSGVKIPKNYKEHKQYFPNSIDYTSFNKLPKELRKALAKRAKENKKEKGLGCFGA